jgi:hypothetical protein
MGTAARSGFDCGCLGFGATECPIRVCLQPPPDQSSGKSRISSEKLTVDTTRVISQEYLLENGSDQIGEFILGKMPNTWLGERLDLRIYQSFREGCSLVTTINENDYPTLFKSFSVRL